jgi:hypothetical protein
MSSPTKKEENSVSCFLPGLFFGSCFFGGGALVVKAARREVVLSDGWPPEPESESESKQKNCDSGLRADSGPISYICNDQCGLIRDCHIANGIYGAAAGIGLRQRNERINTLYCCIGMWLACEQAQARERASYSFTPSAQDNSGCAFSAVARACYWCSSKRPFPRSWAGVHVCVRQAPVFPLTSIAIGLQRGATGHYACWSTRCRMCCLQLQ